MLFMICEWWMRVYVDSHYWMIYVPNHWLWLVLMTDSVGIGADRARHVFASMLRVIVLRPLPIPCFFAHGSAALCPNIGWAVFVVHDVLRFPFHLFVILYSPISRKENEENIKICRFLSLTVALSSVALQQVITYRMLVHGICKLLNAFGEIDIQIFSSFEFETNEPHRTVRCRYQFVCDIVDANAANIAACGRFCSFEAFRIDVRQTNVLISLQICY